MSTKKQCSRLQVRNEFIWGLKNCNSGDTDSGKTESVLGKRKSQGLINTKSHRVSCLLRTVIDSDTSQEIFVFKESRIIPGYGSARYREFPAHVLDDFVRTINGQRSDSIQAETCLSHTSSRASRLHFSELS